MDYRERKSHAQGIYPTQYTLRMRTVRMKQKEETDTRMMQESIVRNQEERNLGMKEKNLKQDPTSAKNLTIELSEGRKSPPPYHRSMVPEGRCEGIQTNL